MVGVITMQPQDITNIAVRFAVLFMMGRCDMKMKITELIENLEHLRNEHGDLDVYIFYDGDNVEIQEVSIEIGNEEAHKLSPFSHDRIVIW